MQVITPLLQHPVTRVQVGLQATSSAFIAAIQTAAQVAHHGHRRSALPRPVLQKTT